MRSTPGRSCRTTTSPTRATPRSWPAAPPVADVWAKVTALFPRERELGVYDASLRRSSRPAARTSSPGCRTPPGAAASSVTAAGSPCTGCLRSGPGRQVPAATTRVSGYAVNLVRLTRESLAGAFVDLVDLQPLLRRRPKRSFGLVGPLPKIFFRTYGYSVQAPRALVLPFVPGPGGDLVAAQVHPCRPEAGYFRTAKRLPAVSDRSLKAGAASVAPRRS